MGSRLVDLIHESAFVPELWTKVLEHLAKIADARGGALYAPGAAALRLATFPELVDDWIGRDGRRQKRGRLRPPSGFVPEKDVFASKELDRYAVFPEFLRPQGFGWGVAAALPAGAGAVFLGLERDYARGPVDSETLRQLDAYYPHLAQSALVCGRLQLERARVAGETLALLGLPALTVDESGKALFSNHLVEGLGDFLGWRAKGRLALRDARAEAFLKQAIATCRRADARVSQSFLARAVSSQAQLVVHVIPIQGTARDLFAGCAAIIVMSPLDPMKAAPAALIQKLFDLTPMEARVAHGLARGATLDELASEGSVSRNTVRTQLRAVFEKTGCARQAEVVSLLSRISLGNG